MALLYTRGERFVSLPAKDVVSQLGSLHGSPLALGLPIPPLHILPLLQVKVLAHDPPLA